jgi:8-amino-3,8-dideoxy-alpha-D-manno-octulosonate transaminase
MYHFINQWDHLKELRTASALPINLLGSPQQYATLQLPKSQQTIGRLISFGIRCTWKEDEVVQLGKQIASCIQKALQPAHV